ncbi:MAG TPA: hypothetical protein GX506_08620 [Firmicutes bacterium]|nr:hypothetical protein [Bacillota bacterium]
MKRFKGLNILVIIIAFGVTFAGLVGASGIGYRLGTERPLESFLKSRPYVSRYRTINAGQGMRLEIEMGRGADLPSAYRELVDGVYRITGNRNVQLVLHDRRDQHLSQAYHEMHFAIQEAIVTGQFTLMNSRLHAIAGRYGIARYSVTVDAGNIYVQLADGDHYLYEVVPRAVPDRAAGNPTGASGPEKGGVNLW